MKCTQYLINAASHNFVTVLTVTMNLDVCVVVGVPWN